MAMITTAGGHFASAVAAARLQERRCGKVRVTPVDVPLPEIVSGLNVTSVRRG